MAIITIPIICEGQCVHLKSRKSTMVNYLVDMDFEIPEINIEMNEVSIEAVTKNEVANFFQFDDKLYYKHSYKKHLNYYTCSPAKGQFVPSTLELMIKNSEAISFVEYFLYMQNYFQNDVSGEFNLNRSGIPRIDNVLYTHKPDVKEWISNNEDNVKKKIQTLFKDKNLCFYDNVFYDTNEHYNFQLLSVFENKRCNFNKYVKLNHIHEKEDGVPIKKENIFYVTLPLIAPITAFRLANLLQNNDQNRRNEYLKDTSLDYKKSCSFEITPHIIKKTFIQNILNLYRIIDAKNMPIEEIEALLELKKNIRNLEKNNDNNLDLLYHTLHSYRNFINTLTIEDIKNKYEDNYIVCSSIVEFMLEESTIDNTTRWTAKDWLPNQNNEIKSHLIG